MNARFTGETYKYQLHDVVYSSHIQSCIYFSDFLLALRLQDCISQCCPPLVDWLMPAVEYCGKKLKLAPPPTMPYSGVRSSALAGSTLQLWMWLREDAMSLGMSMREVKGFPGWLCFMWSFSPGRHRISMLHHIQWMRSRYPAGLGFCRLSCCGDHIH